MRKMEFLANPKIQQAVEWLIQKKDKAVDITKRVLIAADQKITALGDWAIRSWNSVNLANISSNNILAKVPVAGFRLPESWNKGVGYGLSALALALATSEIGRAHV